MSYPNPYILTFFEYKHLPDYLQPISKQFYDLAHFLASIPFTFTDEREVAFRKLLEAKDAAVRAALIVTPTPVREED